MGQKAHPIGNRLGIIRGWDSNWFGGNHYADKLVEDEKIRKYISVRIAKGGISKGGYRAYTETHYRNYSYCPSGYRDR